MSTGAIDSLIANGLVTRVTTENVEDWLAESPALSVMLFSGRSKNRPEGHDVAVALREFIRAYGDGFRAGIVDDEAENALKQRFRVVLLPSLVFSVGGEVVEVVPRIRDFADYAEIFRRYLGAPQPQAVAG